MKQNKVIQYMTSLIQSDAQEEHSIDLSLKPISMESIDWINGRIAIDLPKDSVIPLLKKYSGRNDILVMAKNYSEDGDYVELTTEDIQEGSLNHLDQVTKYQLWINRTFTQRVKK